MTSHTNLIVGSILSILDIYAEPRARIPQRALDSVERYDRDSSHTNSRPPSVSLSNSFNQTSSLWFAYEPRIDKQVNYNHSCNKGEAFIRVYH